MVTHVPPSPTSSSVSLSTRSASDSRARQTRAPHHEKYRPVSSRSSMTQTTTSFPPSPAASYTSPPSSYTARVYPSQAATAYTPSRAPSIDSRASTSAARDHRHRRRHSRHRISAEYGQPSEVLSRNAFPWFSESGNVEIILREPDGRVSGRRYLLHSLLLAQNAGFFARDLDSNTRSLVPSSTLPSPYTQDHCSRRTSRRSISKFSVNSSTTPSVPNGYNGSTVRYELAWQHLNPQVKDDLPMLVRDSDSAFDDVQQHLPTSRKPPTSSTNFFRRLVGESSQRSSHNSRGSQSSMHLHDSRAVDDLLDAYNNLFLIFYNHNPSLDLNSISNAYAQCKTLLSLAVRYDAVSVVAPRIDYHLLRFHRQLWPHIARYPVSYLKLGHLSKSRAILAEALIHVVGQWPSSSAQLPRGSIDDSVLDLIEDKVEDLEDAKMKVDVKLLRLMLTTSRGERVTPTNSWLDWLALSLFRQWVAEHTATPSQGILKDPSKHSSSTKLPNNREKSPGAAYHMLGIGDQAYLPRDELKRFLKLHPENYSRDNLHRFERRMDELKNLARDAVKPLTRSFLEMESSVGGDRLRYLTCTRVDDRDYDMLWRN